MLNVLLALMLILFSACARPPPGPGAARHETRLGDQHYTLLRQGDRVEVRRAGPAIGRDGAEIRAMLREVVPWLTGCELSGASIDPAGLHLSGQIRCPWDR